MYTDAILGEFNRYCELVAICDTNLGRMELKNRELAAAGHCEVPMYAAADFDRMIDETKPDEVIVTTGPDVTHSDYIIRAMVLGCNVITEKPMTTDEVRCRGILQTARDTGRKVRVTFNYRYAPYRSQVKELLMDGIIGEILGVDFTWPLDTRHGADYFRRWHRFRENSGSLLVHKATHHFDLVNWWLEDVPEEVFCHASRLYYTPATADGMGLGGRSDRCLTCPVSGRCRFYLDLAASDRLKKLYLDNEQHDGYFRDRCVFGEEVDIWDNMSVSVRYRRGSIMNYFLLAYSPWEGYQIAFNGTKGRLEQGSTQFSYISGEKDGVPPGQVKNEGLYLTLHPHFGRPQGLKPRTGAGGHGGGDPVLLRDIFDPNAPADPLKRRACQRDGAYSILTGVAACRSVDTGRAVKIDDLLGGAPLGE
jgi:predicted dehydrogenase